MDQIVTLEVTFYGDIFLHSDQDYYHSLPFVPAVDDDGIFEGHWDDNAGQRYTHVLSIPNENLNDNLRLTDDEIETGLLSTEHYNALRKAVLAIIESEIVDLGKITPVCYDDLSVGASVRGMLGPHYPDAIDHYTQFMLNVRVVRLSPLMPQGGGE